LLLGLPSSQISTPPREPSPQPTVLLQEVISRRYFPSVEGKPQLNVIVQVKFGTLPLKALNLLPEEVMLKFEFGVHEEPETNGVAPVSEK